MPTLMDIVRSRRSIRRYLPAPLERETVLDCLEAARLAPSAHNVQPWRFLVIDRPDLKDRLARAAFSGIYKASLFAAQAPVIVVVLGRLDIVAHRIGRSMQGTSFYLVDIGIAVEHLILRAEELGVATCWMGWFDIRKVRKVLAIPRRYKVVALIPMGYAASRPPRESPRKAMAEIAWFNGVEKDGTEEGTGGTAPGS